MEIIIGIFQLLLLCFLPNSYLLIHRTGALFLIPLFAVLFLAANLVSLSRLRPWRPLLKAVSCFRHGVRAVSYRSDCVAASGGMDSRAVECARVCFGGERSLLERNALRISGVCPAWRPASCGRNPLRLYSDSASVCFGENHPHGVGGGRL